MGFFTLIVFTASERSGRAFRLQIDVSELKKRRASASVATHHSSGGTIFTMPDFIPYLSILSTNLRKSRNCAMVYAVLVSKQWTLQDSQAQVGMLTGLKMGIFPPPKYSAGSTSTSSSESSRSKSERSESSSSGLTLFMSSLVGGVRTRACMLEEVGGWAEKGFCSQELAVRAVWLVSACSKGVWSTAGSAESPMATANVGCEGRYVAY